MKMEAEGLGRVLEHVATCRQCLDPDSVLNALEEECKALEIRADRAEELLTGMEQMERESEELTLGELKREEKQLLEEIETMEMENVQLAGEQVAMKEMEEEMSDLFGVYWSQLNQFDQTLMTRTEELNSFIARTDLLIGCRQALKRTNLLNDAFGIWYEGPFGTISGLKLGKLPNYQVEWSEVNAAWGQVALLLVTLARQVHFSFSKYRIIPQGSQSKLAKVGSENTMYELYVNEQSIGGFYFKRSFNNALVCILHCLQELGDYAEKTDRAMRLPFPIEGDTIGGLSIRTSSSETNWTRALKNFLIDLKWLIAWSTRRQRG